jgi:hypothetical protein
VAGDKGYCTKDFVAALRERGIRPHIAFIDDGRRIPGSIVARCAMPATYSRSASESSSSRPSASRAWRDGNTFKCSIDWSVVS